MVFGLFKNSERTFSKHAAKVANKRAQAPDRWESINFLAKAASAEAVGALMKRFSFAVEPSITDHEEKERAYEAILGIGDDAVAPVKASLRKSDSISWPVKILDQLLPKTQMVEALLELLEKMDTDYERDPAKKVQILQTLAERRDERIAAAASRFLDDVSEEARFAAVEAVVSQDNAQMCVAELQEVVVEDESLRVRLRVLEAAARLGWTTQQLQVESKQLPEGVSISSSRQFVVSR